MDLRLGRPVKVLLGLTALVLVFIALISVFAPGDAALLRDSLDALDPDGGARSRPRSTP